MVIWFRSERARASLATKKNQMKMNLATKKQRKQNNTLREVRLVHVFIDLYFGIYVLLLFFIFFTDSVGTSRRQPAMNRYMHSTKAFSILTRLLYTKHINLLLF